MSTDLEHPEELESPKPEPADEDGDDALELLQGVQDVNGKKVVGLDQLIEHRKASKAQKREIAELRAKLAEKAGLEERVTQLLPIAEAVERDPALAKQIKSALDGTRPTRPATEQPSDDPEALEYAQVLGLVTKDKDGNDVYDVARAARALEFASVRAEKKLQPKIDEATNAAYGMRGEQNLSALYAITTPSGEPLATDESIKEVMKESQMPLRMLADPRVARTVGLMAAGLDREKGRTPKEVVEPLYFERAGGRRGESTQISDYDRRVASRIGLSEQDLAATSKLRVSRKGEIDLE